VAAGVLSIPAGLIQAFKIQAFTGEPSDSSRILTIIGPTVIDGAECVARALDRERLGARSSSFERPGASRSVIREATSPIRWGRLWRIRR
jgi:hypothetical protein